MLSKGSEEINFHLYQKTPCENMGVKGTFQVVWILAQAEIFKLFTLTSNLSGLWKKNYLKCKHWEHLKSSPLNLFSIQLDQLIFFQVLYYGKPKSMQHAR